MGKSKNAIDGIATNLSLCLEEYLARQNRERHPDGSFDKGGRWYPSEREQRECCAFIRSPSRAWPYSLMKHCRSVEHVAALFDIDPRILRRAVRLAKESASDSEKAKIAAAIMADPVLLAMQAEYLLGKSA
jgi:hypothetical protein